MTPSVCEEKAISLFLTPPDTLSQTQLNISQQSVNKCVPHIFNWVKFRHSDNLSMAKVLFNCYYIIVLILLML